MVDIRAADPGDWPGIWAIFRDVVEKGDTYPYLPDTTEDEAKALWIDAPRATYVAAGDGEITGTYYLKPNQPGLGSHVCNAGYMVLASVRGQGLGRALCAHSLDEARRLGYRAMQYNLVVGTNKGAVHLWSEMGFKTVGKLPEAFRLASGDYADALVMYRLL